MSPSWKFVSDSRVIVVTPGEPAGIGPDIVVQMAQSKRTIPWLAICDADMLIGRAKQLGLDLLVKSDLDSPSSKAGQLTVLHVPLAKRVRSGILDVANAEGVIRSLDIALEGCLINRYEALVTGPVQKSVINDSGMSFSGHTEYFAEKSGVDEVVMLLVCRDMRVALATTHIPLSLVSETISKALLEKKLRIMIESLRQYFSIANPRILVAGLNPHAGEEGYLGREEIEKIEPVCGFLRDEGFLVEGPMPADTLFVSHQNKKADAIFAMYHDQGLPVLKYAGFGEAVNVTLGLPFIRTSVDHGTGLDIAGSGSAHIGSFEAAVQLASQMRDA